jgi:hypothetical protein
VFSARKNGNLAESHRKKSKHFPVGILLPCFIDFLCFTAGTGSYFLIWTQIRNQVTQGHHDEALFKIFHCLIHISKSIYSTLVRPNRFLSAVDF